jgi:hypothetical protein
MKQPQRTCVTIATCNSSGTTRWSNGPWTEYTSFLKKAENRATQSFPDVSSFRQLNLPGADSPSSKNRLAEKNPFCTKLNNGYRVFSIWLIYCNERIPKWRSINFHATKVAAHQVKFLSCQCNFKESHVTTHPSLIISPAPREIEWPVKTWQKRTRVCS